MTPPAHPVVIATLTTCFCVSLRFAEREPRPRVAGFSRIPGISRGEAGLDEERQPQQHHAGADGGRTDKTAGRHDEGLGGSRTSCRQLLATTTI